MGETEEVVLSCEFWVLSSELSGPVLRCRGRAEKGLSGLFGVFGLFGISGSPTGRTK